MDGARIKALYDKDIVGFDMNGLLVTNCDTWNANQDTYAVAKIDKAGVLSHKIQLPGPNSSSPVLYPASAAPPADERRHLALHRCLAAQREGRVFILNKHCSRLAGG
jgi:hypothetical protein